MLWALVSWPCPPMQLHALLSPPTASLDAQFLLADLCEFHCDRGYLTVAM
jgi:hypothetical protein